MINTVIKVAFSALLKERGKSIYVVSQETGIAYNTLWRISKGKVKSMSFDVLEKLCLNLGCTPNDLLRVKK